MLVISRKPGQKIVLSNGITLTVVAVRGNRVRLAFDAPDQFRILRAELVEGQGEPAGGDGPTEPTFA
ncbi:MAG TPA: carbon storage regulator [Gemmataceae bacterium]|jgi:carbon storage regulator